MEDLIKQAFLHVEGIGPHVQAGHYDLIGPDGEIILPIVWDKMVQPGWQIDMRMWPMDKHRLQDQPSGGMRMPRGGPSMVEAVDRSRPQRRIARPKGRLNHLIPAAKPAKKSSLSRSDSAEYSDPPHADQAALKKPFRNETRVKAEKEPRGMFAAPKKAEEEDDMWETE